MQQASTIWALPLKYNTNLHKYSNIQIFLFFLFAVAAAAAAAAAASGVHGLTAEQQRAMQMGRPIIRKKTKVCLQ